MPQLTFSKRDPRKATITDADTGQLVYQVKTPRTLIDHTTTMWDSQGHIVAEYERTFLSQKATIRGHRMSLDDFLRKKHIAGSRRVWAGPDGRQFEWKHHLTGGFKLTDVQSGQEVASSKSANVLLGRDMQLDVHPDLLPILDFVVLTFIIVEARRQEAIREAANSAGG